MTQPVAASRPWVSQKLQPGRRRNQHRAAAITAGGGVCNPGAYLITAGGHPRNPASRTMTSDTRQGKAASSGCAC